MKRLGLVLLGLFVLVPVVLAQGPIMPAASVTSTVYDGSTPLLPKFRSVDAAINGDNIVIAAVTGKKIRVVAAALTMTGTTVTLQFKSGTGATEEPETGPMQPLQGHTIALPFNPVGWFETSTSTLLNLELGGAQSVDGVIVYVEVD